MPEPGKPTLTTLKRMERAEDVLSQPDMTPKKARRLLAQEWGLTNRQAGRVIRRVYDQWAIESQGMTREQKRAQMRHRLQRFQRKAIDRRGGIFNPTEGCVEWYDNPDVGAASRTAELECRLDGLLEQPETTSVSLDVSVLKVMQQAYGLAEDAGVKELPEGDGEDD